MKSINIQKLNGLEFIHFICSRNSFFQYYKELHELTKEEVINKLQVIVASSSLKDFISECKVMYSAAIQKERPTYYFDKWVGELVELYYSNESFAKNKREIESSDNFHIDKDPISLEWVLQSNQLTRYERYLLFEYLILGYSLNALSQRRYVSLATLKNHLAHITKKLLD